MILEDALNDLICDTVDLLLGESGYTIKSKQKKAPRPKVPYAAVDIMSDTSIGWEQRSYGNNLDNPDLTETITGMRSIMVSVNFYRDNAIDNSRRVRTGLVRESIQSLFRSGGIGLTSRTEVREISEPLENGWEERSQFDIVLNTVGTDSDIVRAVEAVNIAGEFQLRGLTYNSTIEVS